MLSAVHDSLKCAIGASCQFTLVRGRAGTENTAGMISKEGDNLAKN